MKAQKRLRNYSLGTDILLNDSLQFLHQVRELGQTLAVLQQRAVSCWRVTTATETYPHHERCHRLQHQLSDSLIYCWLSINVDQWCLRRTLRICWRASITNEEVHRRTDHPPLTHIICTNHLQFFGHTVRADPSMDHCGAFRACMAPLSRDWNCRSGRPRRTWFRTVESDLTPLNVGLTTAYHRAENRQAWSTLVGMATSSTGQATR